MIKVILVIICAASISSAAIQFPRGQAAHIVATPASSLEKRVLDRLSAYLAAVTGTPPRIVARATEAAAGQPVIVFQKSSTGHPERFTITTNRTEGHQQIVLTGSTDRGLKRAAQKLILKSSQKADHLEFAELEISETPWIEEREWTICPWIPQQVRGAFVNPFADNRMNIWNYSERQLADYVDMYDSFGFSGVQLMETSYSYGVFGSPQAFQDRQRELATYARRNGQNVSLWVWAAEFTGHGWIDPAVTYEPRAGSSAFEDLNVRRGFEKYYDIYAGLAPYIDRLIGHFYDPGNLKNRQDVFRYMRLLEQKFKAKNPLVRMAIDSWGVSHDYLQELIANGFTDYELLEMSMPSFFKPGQREKFHEEAKRLGLKLGVWGWYTTEYETDQLASMYVNARLLQNFYRQMRAGAVKIHPVSYWSEMEAHHLNNIYTMYAASQLLWNPDRDTDEILGELTEGIWGPNNGPHVLRALQLIQDVRSGPTWETYWWTLPGYRLDTERPAEDLARVESVITSLEQLKTDPAFVPKFPLPFPPDVFIRLMLPHLRQLREFARFRTNLTETRRAIEKGLSKEEASRRLSAIWRPIPDYDTWIGTFGQPEERMQSILLTKAADELGLKLVEPAWLRARDAQRLLQKIQLMQRAHGQELIVTSRQMNEFYWPKARFESRLEHLLKEGSIERVTADGYRLVNWRDFASALPE